MMKKAYIKFNVQNQQITRTDDFVVVSGSKHYLHAHFSFTDDWPADVDAIFSGDGCTPYRIPIVSGECEVPWEVLLRKRFYVSCEAGDRITSSTAAVDVKPTGSSCRSRTPNSVLEEQIGDLTKLSTEAKDNLVDAINEVHETGGTGPGGSGGTTDHEKLSNREKPNQHPMEAITGLVALRDRINAFLDSDDQTLDQLTELIQAIKANQGTISQLTNGKVNTADIVNDLTTGGANKVLSAEMGIELKRLIDAIKVPGLAPEDRAKWDAGAEELAVGDDPDTKNTKAHLRRGGTLNIPETADDIAATVPAGLPGDTPKTAQGIMDALAKRESGDAKTAVLYTPQELTREQQMQAQQNIGINTASKVDKIGVWQVRPSNIEGVTATGNLWPMLEIDREKWWTYTWEVDGVMQLRYQEKSNFNCYRLKVKQNTVYRMDGVRNVILLYAKGNPIAAEQGYPTTINTRNAVEMSISVNMETNPDGVPIGEGDGTPSQGTTYIPPEWFAREDLSKVDKDGIGQVRPLNIEGVTATGNLWPQARLDREKYMVATVKSDGVDTLFYKEKDNFNCYRLTVKPNTQYRVEGVRNVILIGNTGKPLEAEQGYPVVVNTKQAAEIAFSVNQDTYPNGVPIAEGTLPAPEHTGYKLPEWLMSESPEAQRALQMLEQITELRNMTITIRPKAPKLGYCSYTGAVSDSGSGKLAYTEKLPATPGDTFTGNGLKPALRFITAYYQGKVQPDKGAENAEANYRNTYTVPDGVDEIVITQYLDVVGDLSSMPSITKTGIGLAVITDESMTQDLPANAAAVGARLNKAAFSGSRALRKTGNLAPGDLWKLESADIKTAKNMAFTGTLTTLGSLSMGHGLTGSYTNFVKIDATNVSFYKDGKLTEAIPHEMAISNNLQVTICTANNNSYDADIRVASNGAKKTFHRTDWGGNDGEIFVQSDGSTLTDCSVSWTCRNYDARVFAYGDSYFGHVHDYRWPYYLLKDGYTHILLDGHAGRNTGEAVPSFRKDLTHGNPDFVFWCMGMNDTEQNAMNATWKDGVDEVIATCRKRGIEPILSTIPCVPGRSNKAKNEYVRASGCRYVDFAKAVGGDYDESTWYPGMLSDDQLHPNTQGAIALYNQVLADFPEIMALAKI